jgi:hypothetical protein
MPLTQRVIVKILRSASKARATYWSGIKAIPLSQRERPSNAIDGESKNYELSREIDLLRALQSRAPVSAQMLLLAVLRNRGPRLP